MIMSDVETTSETVEECAGIREDMVEKIEVLYNFAGNIEGRDILHGWCLRTAESLVSQSQAQLEQFAAELPNHPMYFFLAPMLRFHQALKFGENHAILVVPLYKYFIDSVEEDVFFQAVPDETVRGFDSADRTCAVCWGEIDLAVKIPCGHIFHKICVRKWMMPLPEGRKRQHCPLCRRKYILESPKKIFDHDAGLRAAENIICESLSGFNTEPVSGQYVQGLEDMNISYHDQGSGTHLRSVSEAGLPRDDGERTPLEEEPIETEDDADGTAQV
jgi:hypothetical protein